MADATFDCVLLCHHQSQCARLVMYHDNVDIRPRLFPAGWGPALTEVDHPDRTNRAGPCLVHATGLTTTPEAVTTWIKTTFMCHSIGRAFYLGNERTTAGSKEELVRRMLRHGPPDGAVIRLHCHPRSLEPWIAVSFVYVAAMPENALHQPECPCTTTCRNSCCNVSLSTWSTSPTFCTW
jgi:hypothetical protein